MTAGTPPSRGPRMGMISVMPAQRPSSGQKLTPMTAYPITTYGALTLNSALPRPSYPVVTSIWVTTGRPYGS